MNIAVIGTGNVGATLGIGWARKGNRVTFGTRRADSVEISELLKKAGVTASAATQAEAAKQADIIVLAVPWSATEQALAGLGDLGGKLLIDCTNPVKNWPVLDHAPGNSGGEQVARWVRGAKVVKCFNTTGAENMAHPVIAGERISMFYAGDDAEAKRPVHVLAEELGFDPVDAGPLASSYALEAMASLWGTLAFGQKLGLGIGFRLLR